MQNWNLQKFNFFIVNIIVLGFTLLVYLYTRIKKLITENDVHSDAIKENGQSKK